MREWNGVEIDSNREGLRYRKETGVLAALPPHQRRIESARKQKQKGHTFFAVPTSSDG